MTLAEHVAAAVARLERAGLDRDDATLSASLLARHVLGWSAADWLTRRSMPGTPDFESRFQALVERRSRHEPVAYLTGEREFYGRTFRVTPDVLIPRPETELVVAEAIAFAADAPRDAHLVVVDVGTGSGCLAVTIALELPRAEIVATDVSSAALAIARANARRFGVLDRIDFRHGAFLAGVVHPPALIVANPPYVGEADAASLPPDVRDYEPRDALFAGAGGLDVIRELVPAAAGALVPGGRLVIEIGQGQAPMVEAMIEASGLRLIVTRRDLQAIPRVVVAGQPDGPRAERTRMV